MALLSQEQRIKFLEAAFSRTGSYYCWPDAVNRYSGKDLSGADFPNTYDCSGLVTCSLKDATGLDRRSTWNSARLMKNCQKVTQPQPGDLCFYGSSWSTISHVMIYIGSSRKRPTSVPASHTVFGSSGGDRRTLTLDIAKSMDAKVKSYKSHLYRKDFLGFGRLVTKDE